VVDGAGGPFLVTGGLTVGPKGLFLNDFALPGWSGHGFQYVHNSVDWYPWGDEAFTKAKQEDKPILLSCGYSACHWCNVC
jgi:hypothetical protein